MKTTRHILSSKRTKTISHENGWLFLLNSIIWLTVKLFFSVKSDLCAGPWTQRRRICSCVFCLQQQFVEFESRGEELRADPSDQNSPCRIDPIDGLIGGAAAAEVSDDPRESEQLSDLWPLTSDQSEALKKNEQNFCFDVCGFWSRDAAADVDVLFIKDSLISVS